MSDPSVDVSNAPAQTPVQDNDNPLATKSASPRVAAQPSSPVDQDAVDLLTSPGSTAAKAFTGPQAPDPNADTSLPPDMVNGNDSTPNPLAVPIRRAQKAPDSAVGPPQPSDQGDEPLPQKNDAPPSLSDSSAQTAQVETAPSIQPAPSLAMKLRLNDLIALQKAAEEAGGSLRIEVATVGINPEDLIQPLRKQGVFNVEIGKDKASFMVSSKDDELGQVDALTVKRRQLLEQIADLQSEVATLNQQKGAVAQATVPTPPDTDSAPDQAPATPLPAPSPSSGKPAELILSNR